MRHKVNVFVSLCAFLLSFHSHPRAQLFFEIFLPEGLNCSVTIGNVTNYMFMLENISSSITNSTRNKTVVPLHWNCSATTGAQSCPSGLFSTPASFVCNIQCPAAYYCPGNGSALLCPSGTYSLGGADSPACTSCPVNYFCVGGIKTVCPDGKLSSAGSSICSILCPAGFYCPGVGYTIQCSIPGTYSLPGAAKCTTCEAGYYCPTVASHLFCPINTWSLSGSMSGCTLPCPNGVLCPGNGKMSCTVCAPNEFTVKACSVEGDTICNTTCPPGMFGAFYTKGFCRNCDTGYYNDKYSVTTCVTCTPGKYANTTGNSACTTCPAGYNTNRFTGYIDCHQVCCINKLVLRGCCIYLSYILFSLLVYLFIEVFRVYITSYLILLFLVI